MFSGKARLSRWPLFAVVAILLTSCSQGSNPTSHTPEPDASPSVAFIEPVEGEVPQQQAQIAGSSAPRAFPVLLDEKGVHAYLEGMFKVSLSAVKNRRPYEVVPQLVRVKKSAACTKVPGAKGEQPAYRVGDKAPSGSPFLAPCVKDGKLVMFFASAKFYQFYRDNNVPEVRSTVIRAVQDYLAQLSRNRLGGDEGYFSECAGGRLIGGLREGAYIEVQWANIQELDGPADTPGEQVYVTARDQGWCSNEWVDNRP